jgi:hypothetical protein
MFVEGVTVEEFSGIDIGFAVGSVGFFEGLAHGCALFFIV